VADPSIPREDVVSAVGARRELGDELEPEVVDAFLARVERAIDARVEARLAARREGPGSRSSDHSALALAIVSLGTGIPITAIAVTESGLLGLLVAWIGIVALNVAYARRTH
jgi:membrane-associated phospholipid phosphatase